VVLGRGTVVVVTPPGSEKGTFVPSVAASWARSLASASIVPVPLTPPLVTSLKKLTASVWKSPSNSVVRCALLDDMSGLTSPVSWAAAAGRICPPATPVCTAPAKSRAAAGTWSGAASAGVVPAGAAPSLPLGVALPPSPSRCVSFPETAAAPIVTATTATIARSSAHGPHRRRLRARGSLAQVPHGEPAGKVAAGAGSGGLCPFAVTLCLPT